jgi:ElaB/YqjD/DUF883 family membrane-anchored ribosome-binding protein
MKMQLSTGTDKLMKDLRAVVVDTEELLKATAGQTGERIEKVRARAEESLRNARTRVQVASQDVQAAAQDAMREVDSQVRQNPWTAVGVAAAIGLVMGILIGRK